MKMNKHYNELKASYLFVDIAHKVAAYQEAAARKTVLAAGCREIQLSDEEKERFRELVQPLYEKYAGPYLELVKKIQQG